MRTDFDSVRVAVAFRELRTTVSRDLTSFCYLLRDLTSNNKKLSYRRETARQLHTTTWAGQLTF